MASDDTAALVVALSAQVSKFEKDMQSAVDIAQRKTKDIENTFSKLNSAVTDKLSQIASSLTGNLGFAGQLLTKLGPGGIAAAAGIGAAVGAIVSLANASAEFAEKSKILKEASETAGLSIAQFKLLGAAGKTVGLDFEETSGFFTKYISNIEALRNGGGPLYDALLKIDTGLLRQLASTKSSADAIDILIKAYAKLDDAAAKLNLARAAGGRGGLSGGRLLESLGQNGGMDAINAKTPDIDESVIKRAAQLRDEIAAIQAKTNGIWGSMFSDTFLNSSKQMAQDFQNIAMAVANIVKETKSGLIGNDFNSRFKGDGTAPPLDFTKPLTKVRISGGQQEPPPPAEKVPASVDLALLQRNIALLGDAVTQGEQWKLKRLEIAAAQEKGGISDGVAARSLAAFGIVMRASALAAREQLGIANEQQITEVKLAQLQQERTKYGLSENEVLQATTVIMREAKAASEALEVRRSYLPGLKQLELDAQNVSKNLDTTLTSGLNSVTDDLAAFATGTKTAKEAFADMATSILNDLTKLLIRQNITGPLAKLLGGFFGGGSGIFGLADGGPVGSFQVGSQSFPKFAGGGAVTGSGGPRSDDILIRASAGEYVMNAAATAQFRPLIEAMNSGRIQRFADGGLVMPETSQAVAQIVPNDIRGRSGSSATTINYSPVIDARGADAAAVARLAQVVSEDKKNFARNVLTIQTQYRANNPRAA